MTDADSTTPDTARPAGAPGPIAASDNDVLTAADAWLDEGRRCALATVVETWGSSPRPVGSQLLIDQDNAMLGSVSGGCIEGAVIHEAQEVMRSGTPRLLEYGVSDEDAWAVGLACGGTIQVYVEPLG